MRKLILLFIAITICNLSWGQTQVGSGQTYTTLKAAFDAINAGTLTGDVVLQITSNTTETATAALNATGGSANYSSVTIYPTGSGYTISGAVAGAIIQLNGADYVTIDGRVSQSGAKDLIIQNTNTSNSTIQLTADATYNTVKYCVIKGATTSTSNGIVFINAGTSTGNDNNTIDNCDIDANSSALNCIYATGPASATANNTVTISNNNLFNYRGAGSAINMVQYNGDWTIDGNSIYQTTAYAGAGSTTIYGINIGGTGASSNTVIKNNYIGGNAPSCSGTWTINGTAATYKFEGMRLNFSATAGSKVYNNTIKGFSWLSSSGSATVPGIWAGVYILSGSVDVGTDGANSIGATTGTGSITVSINGSGSAAAVYGIVTAASSISTLKVENNNLGSITATQVTSTNCSNSVYPIYVANGACTINGNNIGSTSTSNSINAAATNSASNIDQFVYGINSITTGAITISNNVISNLNNAFLYSSSAKGLNKGINVTSSTGAVSITGNTIYTITAAQPMTGTGSSANIMGISMTASGASGVTISGNKIYGLSNTHASAAVNVAGIYYNGNTTGTNTVEKNLIHSLSLSTSNTSGAIIGIITAGGTTNYQNNMVRLGIDAAGANIVTGASYTGISDGNGTNNFYFNSVYIGGSAATGLNSYAFNSSVTTNIRAFQNNIFVNNRTNSAGTAKHYAIKVGGSGINPTGLTCNYNLIYANGASGAVFGFYGADVANLAAWRAVTGQDLNSGNGDPNYTNATTDISASPTTYALKVSGTTPAEASGFLIAGITDDIEGNTRSSQTPTDIGADAGSYTASDIFTPTFTYTNFINTSSLLNRDLSVTLADIGTGVPTTGSLMPRIWFRNLTTSSAWASTAGVLNTGNGNSGTWTFTVDYTLIGGAPSGGNSIQYYLVAQDQAGTPNIWYSPYVGASHSDVNTQTTAPTTPNSYTILNTFGGTISVGSGQTYTTLTATGGLFEAINAGAVTGNVIVNIVSDITETGANPLNQWVEEGAGNYTLTIQSDGTLRTLSNSVNLLVPMIKINGADRVTIDGLAGKKLLFRNTNTAAGSATATVLFDNGSTSCTLTNCVIENNSTSTSTGSVQVNTTGTNDITISSNEIRNPTGGTVNDYYQGIYSNSSTNKLSVSSNSIYNWTNYGIRLNAAADACTVSGNSLYRTSSWAVTSVTVIAVKGGNGHTISGNYIGGNDVNCGGAALTNTGNVFFMGLDVTNVGTTSTTNITNNTFQNINLSGTGSVTFLGISGGSAKLNVGNTVGTGNLIGHTSTAQSIRVSGTNTTAFTGIGLNGTGAATVYGVNYNEIANIYVTANTAVKAIDVAAASSAVASITYNNIHDITAFNTGTTAAIRGINNSGASGGTLTISNNTLSNFISPCTNTGATTSFAVIGILCTSTVNTQNITNNTISGLSLTTAGNNAVKSAGIMVGGSSSSGSISKNNISGFTSTSTSTTNQMVGIYLNNGSFTVDNNIVSLVNGSNTNVVLMQGILDAVGALGTNNYYYNSVNIGGSAASGAVNSFAFSRSAATTIVIKDNIFSNQRTGGTGKHIAIALQANSTITSDYNDLFASNSANIGSVNGGTASLDFATWKSTVTGQDANSVSVSPAFSSATDLHTAVVDLNNKGTDVGISYDIAGATRTGTFDMGAYEFALDATVATVTPLSTISANGATLLGTVNANNESATGTFEYGLTDSYGSTSSAWTPSPVTGIVATDVTVAIASLQPNTLYHYRINATTPKGTVNGVDQTFTTNASATCTFTGATSNAWEDATNWDNGLPGDNTNVTIPANLLTTLTGYGECNDLTISPKGKLTIIHSIAALLNVGGDFLIQSDATGTGSFVGVSSDYGITGTSSVQRYITGVSNAWHQISSPVVAQPISTAFTISPATEYDFFTWYETTSEWVNFKNTDPLTPPTWNTANGSTNFVPGKGYLVAYLATNPTKTFTGTLNAGPVVFPLSLAGSGTYAKTNLAGNPYPSSIDWQNDLDLDKSHLDATGGGHSFYTWNETESNYGSYSDASLVDAGTNGVNRYIAPMQGFIVAAASAGDLTFDDGARVHSAQAWLKSSNEGFRLKVTAPENKGSDEISFELGHSSSIGGAAKWNSFVATAPSLSTPKSGTEYSISFLESLTNETVIPVTFKAGIDGQYSLAANLENLPEAHIYLVDNKLSKTQNLSDNPVYTFAASTTDEPNRFKLTFKSVGIGETEVEQPFTIYATNNTVFVANTSATSVNCEVYVYNTLGQVMAHQILNGDLTKINLAAATGYYLVKVITKETTFTGKVFVKQ